MAEARERAEWNRTAQMLCLLAEPHRDRKRRSSPFMPGDFHPYMQARRREAIPPEDIDGFAVLKAAFLGGVM